MPRTPDTADHPARPEGVRALLETARARPGTGATHGAALARSPEPRCPVCRTREPRTLFEKQGKRFWLCRACELVFVHDIYPEYESTIEAHLDTRERAARELVAKPRQVRAWDRLLDSLERERSTGRLLEVGSGAGGFLRRARGRGWAVRGIEILPEVAAFAREELGLDVRETELPRADLPAASFDVVYMNEVIEHVVDPVELLAAARRVLRPGGLAVLRTGNGRSWSARLRGREWPYFHFCGRGHIRFWSPRSARALARAAGFEEAACSTRGFALREGDELAGRRSKPWIKLAQSPVSRVAPLFGAGHRLVMRLRRGR